MPNAHAVGSPVSAGDAETLYGIPGLPFVPAIRVPAGCELVFVSGVLGLPDGADADTELVAEVHRVYRNLTRVLQEADATLDDVVSLTKFLVDIGRDNEVVAEITSGYFPRLTTSTTVEVRRFVPEGPRLEVSAIAAIAR
jgi:2-iminobutanoate/2-iminopropanoate deaminase